MIESFGVHQHQYANDTQLQSQMAKSAMASQAAVLVVHRWRTSVAPQQQPLSLNPSKTDVVHFPPVEALATPTSLEASGVTIQPASVGFVP
jgi:hypothetical protein